MIRRVMRADLDGIAKIAAIGEMNWRDIPQLRFCQ